MKTSYSIYMDYQKALRQAAKIDNAAAAVRKEAAALREAGDTVSSSWQGPPSGEYRRRITSAASDLRELERKLTAAADAVRRIAYTTYRAEQRAIEIANTRTY